jgi:GMP synthase (glutamine-hydrolysing)
LFIIKVGSTFPNTLIKYGDFDQWTLDKLGSIEVETQVVDTEQGLELPEIKECAGVIITGSHAMVTEELPWSVRLEKWIPQLLDKNVPFLGVCYGHQLLAKSLGGQVDFHTQGKEIGTVDIELQPEALNDPLFRGLPAKFAVHSSHSQSVLRLPRGATHLASNDYEPNHAFRIGDSAWGVQFHPEYDVGIMKSYILEQREELEAGGKDVSLLLEAVIETPFAEQVLRNFAQLIMIGIKEKGKRVKGKGQRVKGKGKRVKGKEAQGSRRKAQGKRRRAKGKG